MATIATIKSQLQNLLAHRPGVNPEVLFTYEPAFNHIHEVLADDDMISGYCTGSLTKAGKQVKAGKWLIICTRQQLTLLHKAAFTDLTHIEIPLATIAAATTKFGWLSNKLMIRDAHTDWELYQVNKTDLRFFESALRTALSAVSK